MKSTYLTLIILLSTISIQTEAYADVTAAVSPSEDSAFFAINNKDSLAEKLFNQLNVSTHTLNGAYSVVTTKSISTTDNSFSMGCSKQVPFNSVSGKAGYSCGISVRNASHVVIEYAPDLVVFDLSGLDAEEITSLLDIDFQISATDSVFTLDSHRRDLFLEFRRF